MAPESAGPTPRAQRLADIAMAAGRAIMPHYVPGAASAHELKSDGSPVTAADHASEAVITSALRAAWPQTPVIAEEAWAAGRCPEPETRFFLVDPLDGTKEFIRGSGEFTVNIALVEAGTPVAASVAVPALGLVYAADGTAHMADWNAIKPARPIDWRPIRARPRPATPLTAVVSAQHFDAGAQRFLDGLLPGSVERVGSSLKFCLIAAGHADVYPRFFPAMEWDVAAGACILAAAGGRTLDTEGMPLTFGHRERGYRLPPFVAWGAPAP